MAGAIRLGYFQLSGYQLRLVGESPELEVIVGVRTHNHLKFGILPATAELLPVRKHLLARRIENLIDQAILNRGNRVQVEIALSVALNHFQGLAR